MKEVGIINNNILLELHRDLVLERPGRLDYTQRAFVVLPKLDKPNVLDIGCGNGAPTLELARLSNGNIIGIDIDQGALDQLEKKVIEQNLSDRIKILNMSMFNLDFPERVFDIIWSEGAIFRIGFENGLKEWRRFIKPDGFLVIHEMSWLAPDPPQEIEEYWQKIYSGITTIQKNLDMIPGCGYSVLDHFPLPEDAWGKLYFDPLAERINAFREKYKNDSKMQMILDKEQREVDLYYKYSKWYGSAYYIIQKKE